MSIARGHDHPHATRVLARAWVRVIWRCWIEQVPYDPVKHGAERGRPAWPARPRTCSPAATSSCAMPPPRPVAPSTAQRRSGPGGRPGQQLLGGLAGGGYAQLAEQSAVGVERSSGQRALVGIDADGDHGRPFVAADRDDPATGSLTSGGHTPLLSHVTAGAGRAPARYQRANLGGGKEPASQTAGTLDATGCRPSTGHAGHRRVDTHLELHVAGVDDAVHDGHHRQQVGDGRQSRGPFVGDEPVVQDMAGTGSQRAKDADGHESSRGELDRLPAGDRVTSTSRRDLSAAGAVGMAVGTNTRMALVPRMPAWRRPGPGGPPGLQNRCEQRPCSGGFDSRPPPLIV